MQRKPQKTLVSSLKSTWVGFLRMTPILLGVVFLVGLVNTIIPKSFYKAVFFHSEILDSFLGALFGSIMVGNPITSYILGGEFLKQGISLVAVLSFIVAWVTVGVVQLPAEAVFLGKKFSITRNIVSFIFAIIVAVVTYLTLALL